MANVFKYFALLESLNLKDTNDNKVQQNNLELLKKCINKDTKQLFKQINENLQLNIKCENLQNPLEDYVVHLLYTLLQIINNVQFESAEKTELISIRQMNLCIEALQHLSHFALWQQLHVSFCKKGVFSRSTSVSSINNVGLLQISVSFYERVWHMKQFRMSALMQDVIRDYMAAIYTLLQLQESKTLIVEAVVLNQWHAYLDFVWTDICKVQYFRNTMLLKGIANLSTYLQQLLHKNLLQKLKTKSGFPSLVSTMLAVEKTQTNEEHIIEIIARIVTNSSLSQNFQSCMIKNIFEFLEKCILHAANLKSTPTQMSNGMRASILSLRRFYDANNENKKLIEQLLQQLLQAFIQPEDLLSGLLLMEHQKFCLTISLLFQLFCTSSVECLPSLMLLKYLPLLLQLHFHLPQKFIVQQQLGMLVTRCLDNCQNLDSCLKHLYSQEYPEEWQVLHRRIRLALDETQTIISVKIAASKLQQDFSISLALPEILMTQQHNQLSYQIFMLLLKQFATLLQENQGNVGYKTNIGLLQTEEELQDFIKAHYSVKLEILYTLNQLVTHAPLRAQFSENAKEYLKFLQDLLKMRLSLTQTGESKEELDQVLLMLLLVCQELLEHAQMLPDLMQNLAESLQELLKITANKLLQDCIGLLLPLLRGEFNFKAAEAKTAFNTARQLIESHESYLQVQGLNMLLDLLRRKDKVTHLNKHVIIALSLNTLRARESYTFLNCVRLFVSLVYVMEAEVLEVLCDEYMNDKNEMDYRLVVGEALLKVSKEIGPLCYKYKDVLLNCFLNGARSDLNEFRMSSFTNLAQLCNILCYQVQRFFNELLNLIDNELSFGKYLPAKRAAVLVLSELLEGMENLIDFQEMLLPLYRLLKAIEANGNGDSKMRTHAANGLKALNEKCYNLLFKEQELTKEIKILNIKDNSNANKFNISTKNILELN